MRLWRDRFPGKTIVAGGTNHSWSTRTLPLTSAVLSRCDHSSMKIFISRDRFKSVVPTFCNLHYDSFSQYSASKMLLSSHYINSSPPTLSTLCVLSLPPCVCPSPGIDRLERLKGIPLKLIAIEQFLEEQPQWRGKLVFNMIGELGTTL